ncbi:MAG: SDR family NAD(P)-dependent oxidoreductase [Bacteroidales bacterium]|jgi:short-subunit dehydrogenase|nr:SDR family NAD(P)-dependent oxidoreductase [Bacteroidales bacterium]MCK9499221.1 SDR family NAD(P)-dependent oxidoreductase [Bacteroidales bacterium]MDY0315030.1 SDR family NAD(P)-dependent oxidoreductase [Bacteroidales bacterium]NLB85463.1 SDR family NAD(P)-dependent oxidoreductase [Bacteroidales bacterium]
MLNLNNKIVWITGASSGIGEACVYELAKEKAKIIITARNKDKLEKIKQKSLELGASDCKVLDYDLSDIENIENLVEQANSFFGKIDIMFNNAGISQRALAGDTIFEVDKKIMDINFFAPVKISKLLLKKFIENGSGTFVVTTSITGRFGFPLRSAYSASKHALYGFFETVHAEYFDKNINVVLVCPGRVNTNISYYALEKDGTQHSKLDPGQAGGISSEKAAKKIVKAIKKQKPEVLVGGKELLMLYIKRFLPALSRKLTRKIKPE